MNMPPNADKMDEASMERARRFANMAIARLAATIQEMQLNRGEVEVGFAYILGESLSHHPKASRDFYGRQLHKLIAEIAETIGAEGGPRQ
jgi:hypothetical protein